MKICFVGVGSIARRHIRNLRNIFSNKTETELQIDAFRRTDKTDEAVDGVDKIYTNFDEIPCDYDAIFITNPTELHLEMLRRFHDKGRHFFIEKPAVSVHQIEVAKNVSLRNSSVYYVACPLRYNAVIQYIKSNVNPGDIISVRSISSSYLPDWRPGQDYRHTYSAHKDMGGGVSIDLIHEWDYLTYLFGWPSKVSSFIGRKSSLEIDSDDYAIYMAEYKDKIVELHLDYFGRKTIRELQLFTKDDSIIADLVNNQIRFLCTGEALDFHEERDDYQKRELQHFLSLIRNGSHNNHDSSSSHDEFTHALNVLELTQGKLRGC